MSNNHNWEREKLIHKYATSLDNGDMDGLAEVLDAACSDPELARITEEIDLAFQEADGCGLGGFPHEQPVQEEEGVAPIASDAELVRKLALSNLHSAFDPLPDSKLDFSIIKDKQLEEVMVGDIALMLKKAGRIPKRDRDKIDLLLNNQTIIPKNQGIKDLKNLFKSLSLNVAFSSRFLDIFRVACIKTSMHIELKNSSPAKVINIGCNLINGDW